MPPRTPQRNAYCSRTSRATMLLTRKGPKTIPQLCADPDGPTAQGANRPEPLDHECR